jgi:hypothetical protein
MDCPMIATKIFGGLNVGLCKTHADELLAAAVLMKMTFVKYGENSKKPIKKLK